MVVGKDQSAHANVTRQRTAVKVLRPPSRILDIIGKLQSRPAFCRVASSLPRGLPQQLSFEEENYDDIA